MWVSNCCRYKIYGVASSRETEGSITCLKCGKQCIPIRLENNKMNEQNHTNPGEDKKEESQEETRTKEAGSQKQAPVERTESEDKEVKGQAGGDTEKAGETADEQGDQGGAGEGEERPAPDDNKDNWTGKHTLDSSPPPMKTI